MQNMLIKKCEKFHYDRLRNDKALGSWMSDNNKNTDNNTNNVRSHWGPVSGSKNWIVILRVFFAAERKETSRVRINRIYLDRHPDNWDNVHGCDDGYCEGNVRSVRRLSELCHEEKHRIFHDLYLFLSAGGAVGVLLRSNYPRTSIQGYFGVIVLQ